jgi:hypothetical protein
MRKAFVVVLRYSDLPTGMECERWRYKSRDAALARVTAIFVQHPLADLDEITREILEGGGVVGQDLAIHRVDETIFTLTVVRG